MWFSKCHDDKIFCFALMVELKKGHNLVNISRKLLKSSSSTLKLDSKPYAKYLVDKIFLLALRQSQKRVITLPYWVRPPKNNTCSLIFCSDTTYKISSS